MNKRKLEIKKRQRRAKKARKLRESRDPIYMSMSNPCVINISPNFFKNLANMPGMIERCAQIGKMPSYGELLINSVEELHELYGK